MARRVGSLNNFVQTEQNSLSGIQEKISTYEMIFEQLKKMAFRVLRRKVNIHTVSTYTSWRPLLPPLSFIFLPLRHITG
jgi:hypothetical protein